MSREIYTYTNLKDLNRASYWNRIKDFPQITVSFDLKNSLKNLGTWVYGATSLCSCEMRKLTEAAFPKWRVDETKFHETVVLSQYIREQMKKYGHDIQMKRWLTGCRRNLGMILSSIILLEEAGIETDDLYSDGDRNIEFLTGAWKFLQANDPAISEFRKCMKKLEKRSAWDSIFNELFGKTDIQTIVFHGFYYFTPIQERILCLLENVGIKIICLFCYDERYPYANEIWRKSYSVEMGYPDISKWNIERSEQIEPYGEIFEGRKAKISNHLQIKEYGTVLEFVYGVKQASELGYQIYSAKPNAANKILRDFYPEKYGERNILAYPIGQFVNVLNEMWDEDLQDIILDQEKLIECFSSGWLSIDGVSGRQYMQELMDVLPFFADCSRISEWEERIRFLEQIKRKAEAPFRQNLSEYKPTARWQEIMGDPLLNFSVFAVSDEKLDVILSLIRQLLCMAQELFTDDQMVYIRDHIRKLDRILKKYELSNKLYEEEREILKELFEKLSNASGSSLKCFPADISEAFRLYINGTLDDSEIHRDKADMVSPIYHVQAVYMKANAKVHVCFCDIKNMPGGKNEYVWPLTAASMRQCYERTGNKLIRNMMHIMESTYICNRYFLYTALKTQDVQLSWIREMGEKQLAPSPYIRLLTNAIGIEVLPAFQNRISYKRVKEMPLGTPKILPYNKEDMPENTAKEAKMDYEVCPMKYVLGYVVQKYPSFQSEFQQNYAINGLTAAIYSLVKNDGIGIDQIYKNIIELFPAMRKVEKRQVYDYLRNQREFSDAVFSGYSEIEGMRYSDERLKVCFPNREMRNVAIEKYGRSYTPDGRKGMKLYASAENKKDPKFCNFCQHQDYCRLAVFAVDQEGLYD